MSLISTSTSSTIAQVLVVSHDMVGPRMAGPGIRYLNIARQLAKEFDVTLAAPDGSALPESEAFSLLQYNDAGDRDLFACASSASAVVLPSVWAWNLAPRLPETVRIVIDGYDPVLIEAISLGMEDIAPFLACLTQAYILGDFFMCASERQRDWWLGLLEALGRVNSLTVGADPSLRSLLATVPYGMPTTKKAASRGILRQLWPQIKSSDRIVLWGGGLWSWLDPLTAIRALVKVCGVRGDVCLIFPGTQHPNPDMSGIPTHTEEAKELAASFGLLDSHVFFGDWVPYESWSDVLVESDVALTLHHDTLESRLAFRSRVLDYIWAGLPTVATRGDATSELIAEYEIGDVVEFGDVKGVSSAILELLEQTPGAWEAGFIAARDELTWDRVVEPLLEYCRNPQPAADKVAGRLGNPFYLEQIAALQSRIAVLQTTGPSNQWSLLRRFWTRLTHIFGL